MRVLLLGCGLQGRAVVHDLVQSPTVEHVTCADANVAQTRAELEKLGSDKTVARAFDAGDPEALASLMREGFDVAIDVLPRKFVRLVGEAAIESGVHLVNTGYDREIADLDSAAREAGIAILPEMGLDPGIDLVMAAEAIRRFDRVTHLSSYGGGMPEPGADDNPLRYRISWTWEGVLSAYARPSRLIREGRIVEVPAANIFDEEMVHTLEVKPFGELEAYPNGDAAEYAKRFGIVESAQDVGRYALRWPGHCQLWRTLTKLGFLSEQPIAALRGISPREFLVKHLEPQLQYAPEQRDLVILRVEAKGERANGKSLILELIDYRDMNTGLMAMNRTVGFPASIAAQMVATGAIAGRGVLSPIRDVPWAPFVAELADRGIEIVESAA
jgi:lysine 6-dehydrogenase